MFTSPPKTPSGNGAASALAPRERARGVRLTFERRVMLAFAASIVVSVVAVTAFVYLRLRQTVLDETIAHQEAYARTLGGVFERELEGARLALEFLSRQPVMRILPHIAGIDPALHGIPERLDREKRRVIDAFLLANPQFSVVFMLLPSGDFYLAHPFQVQRHLEKFNLSGRLYFQEVSRTHRTVISDSFLGADGVRAVAIDVPILDEDGELVAHLGGALHLRDLSELVDSSRIGPYTAGFVVDGQGALIAHTNPAMLTPSGLTGFAGNPLLAPPQGADAPKAIRTLLYSDPADGMEYAGTIVPLRDGRCFGLVQRMDAIDLAVIGHSLRTAALVAMLMLFLSGVGMLAAHRIGLRWDQAEGALRRMHDDMEGQVRQRGADLIASNAALEREIAERRGAEEELRAHRERLEELVVARTAELQGANLRLREEIGERERAEENLRQRESHLRSVVSSVPIVMFATDREGVFTVSEGKGLQALGLKPGQVVGVSVFDIYLDRPDIHLYVRRALAGESLTATVNVGGLLFETVYAPLLSAGGEIAGMIGVAMDITERVHAEQALRQNESSLARAQQIAHVGSWEWDLRRNEMTWSAELFRILGLEPGQVPASYDGYLDRVPPPHRERVKAALSHAVEAGEPVALEHPILLPSGMERLVDLRAEVYPGRGGRPERLFAALHDIHERKTAEQELKTVAEKLDLSNSNLLELSYLASHDLQEPVFSMLSLADRISERLDAVLDAESRTNLELIRRAGGRMMSLIEEMLSLARVTTQTRPLVGVDLGPAVSDVLADLSGRIEAVGGEVEVGSLPIVLADPVQIRQLLQNLIGNALKFHKPEESPLVKVVAVEAGVDGSVPPGFCRISVEDNGIGFDPALTDRLFQPFQRLGAEAGYSGSGIGLAICKRIVERHGGTIDARTRVGGGARFSFTLPLPGTAEGRAG